LVVIDILIALQVNNWNNQRLNLQLSKTYIKALRHDAVQDILELTRHLFISSQYIQKVEALYQRTRSPNNQAITKADLDQIGIIRQTFFLGDDTYQEIIANGQLALLPNDLKTKLK
jgi:hypothetical protein